MFTLWSDIDRVLWNHSLSNLLRYDRGFDRSCGDLFVGSSRMNLTDKGESLEFVVELPGVNEQDIDLDVHPDTLTLKAERKMEEKGTKRLFHINERSGFRVQRSISLPVNVNPNEVTASLQDGVLRVTLPKAPEAKPRRIQIAAK